MESPYVAKTSKSNLYEGMNAQEKLVAGFNTVSKSVAMTLGAKGKNALIQDKGRPGYRLTNDGISIAHSIHFKDVVMEMGADIAREVSKRANDQSGDGTTTALGALAPEILNQGIELTKQGIDGLEIAKSLEDCLPFIEKGIDNQTKTISSHEELVNVAITSAENVNLGTTIADIYKVIGKEGNIEVNNSGSTETTWEEIKGIRFPGAKLFSSAFLSKGKQEYVKEEPIIFVTNQPIRDIQSFNNLLKSNKNYGIENFILIADEVEDRVLKYFTMTEGGSIIIKAPTIDKEAFFEDICEATGAKMINAKSGTTLDKAEYKHHGSCERITVGLNSTTVYGGNDLTDYIQNLKETLDEETPLLKERLARLPGKAATLKIGAQSENQLTYLRDKAEDCVNSTKHTLEEGYVAGGGVAHLNLIACLPDTIGGKILAEAFKRPILKIKENAGNTKGFEGEGTEQGFDAKTGTIVNMFEAGIIDSARVTKNSIQAAIGVVSNILSVGAVITQIEPQQAFMIAPPHK